MTPVLSAVLATFYLRAAVEMAAFAEASTHIETVQAEVVGKTKRSVEARTHRDARTLWIRADADLRAQLDPRRTPGRDCLIIGVETGRWGVRRTRLPNAFDDGFGIDRLVPCTAYQGEEV